MMKTSFHFSGLERECASGFDELYFAVTVTDGADPGLQS